MTIINKIFTILIVAAILSVNVVTNVRAQDKSAAYKDFVNNSQDVQQDKDFSPKEMVHQAAKRGTEMMVIGGGVGTVATPVGTVAGSIIGAITGIVGGTIEYFTNNTETVKEYTLANGKKVRFQCDDASETCKYVQGNFRGCEALPLKLFEQRHCFFCPLFKVIYEAADKMAVLAMGRLATAFATVIAIGLALYVAFMTLVHVSSITKQDAPKFLGNLMKQSFKFVIAYILLTHANQIYYYLINPLLDGGLNFGKALLFGTQDIGMVNTQINTQYFSGELYRNLETFIAAVQREIGFMQAIGTSLMCIGSNYMLKMEFALGFQMILQGIILALFGFLLSLAFAFYLIDAVVQLGIVGALMPFLIACWPFKMTSQYTNKGFGMLMNSFFVFVFLALVISVNIQLINAAIGNDTSTEVSSADAVKKLNYESRRDLVAKFCEKNSSFEQGSFSCKNFAAGQAKETKEVVDAITAKEALKKMNVGGLQKIFDAINNGEEDKLQEATAIDTMGFIILVICCVFGFKFCSQSSELAGQFASGGIKGIGSKIGGMATSAVVGSAKTLTKPMREAASDKIKDGGKSIKNGIKKGAGNLWRGITKRGGGSSGSSDTPSAPSPTAPTPVRAQASSPVSYNQASTQNQNQTRPASTTTENQRSSGTENQPAIYTNADGNEVRDYGNGVTQDIQKNKDGSTTQIWHSNATMTTHSDGRPAEYTDSKTGKAITAQQYQDRQDFIAQKGLEEKIALDKKNGGDTSGDEAALKSVNQRRSQRSSGKNVLNYEEAKRLEEALKEKSAAVAQAIAKNESLRASAESAYMAAISHGQSVEAATAAAAKKVSGAGNYRQNVENAAPRRQSTPNGGKRTTTPQGRGQKGSMPSLADRIKAKHNKK